LRKILGKSGLKGATAFPCRRADSVREDIQGRASGLSTCACGPSGAGEAPGIAVVAFALYSYILEIWKK
jgi:hypothetical protein